MAGEEHQDFAALAHNLAATKLDILLLLFPATDDGQDLDFHTFGPEDPLCMCNLYPDEYAKPKRPGGMTAEEAEKAKALPWPPPFDGSAADRMALLRMGATKTVQFIELPEEAEAKKEEEAKEEEAEAKESEAKQQAPAAEAEGKDPDEGKSAHDLAREAEEKALRAQLRGDARRLLRRALIVRTRVFGLEDAMTQKTVRVLEELTFYEGSLRYRGLL